MPFPRISYLFPEMKQRQPPDGLASWKDSIMKLHTWLGALMQLKLSNVLCPQRSYERVISQLRKVRLLWVWISPVKAITCRVSDSHLHSTTGFSPGLFFFFSFFRKTLSIWYFLQQPIIIVIWPNKFSSSLVNLR